MVAGERPSLASDRQNFASRRADRDVARGDQTGASGEYRAVHARDGRLGKAVERRQHQRERLGVGEVLIVAVLRHALHPVEVGAGAERRAVAGEDDDAHLVILPHGDERVVQLLDESIVERVAQLGPVERDACNAALLVDSEHYIRKTPNFVSSTGALSEAEMARPRSRRVSAGSTTPSSHRRALA